MSGTFKDSKGLPTIPNVYEIVRRPDGSFDIFHNGELADRSIPDEWLQGQLVRYGICGEEYRDARRELDESGNVKLVYETGRIRPKAENTNH
jgi:hypothetical protein